MPGQLVNKYNGETLAIDARKMRISRLRRRCHSWSTALQEYLKHKNKFRLVMITLTYHGFNLETGELLPDYGWEKNQIRDFMKRLRRHCGKSLLAYAWVAEVQQRGAVHYHVMALVKAGTDLPKPDDAGWWVHGSTRIETARSPFYIMKYAQKGTYEGEHGEHIVFPKGLRIFSVWIGDGVIDDLERWSFRLTSLPAWLREVLTGFFGCSTFPKRSTGGGWLVQDELLGEIILSGEWQYESCEYVEPEKEIAQLPWMANSCGNVFQRAGGAQL